MTLIALAIDVAPVENLNVIAVLNVIKSESNILKFTRQPGGQSDMV